MNRQIPLNPNPQTIDKPAQFPPALFLGSLLVGALFFDPFAPSLPLNCEVADHFRITCGLNVDTEAQCTAMSCCFDGSRCFYGKAVTVQVTVDGQFVVVVATDATTPHVDTDTVTLLADTGDMCKPVATNGEFVVFQFPVTACGTIVTEEPGVIIYSNKMVSSYHVETGPKGSITRDSHFTLQFQGRYMGTAVKTLILEVMEVSNPLTAIEQGPLELEIRLGNGMCLTKGCIERMRTFSCTDYWHVIEKSQRL